MAQVTGVAQIHISVRDLQRMVAFYRDVLGLEVVIEAESAVFLDCGGTRLYLAVPESEEYRSNPLLYFAVDDIDGMVAAVKNKGATVRSEPHVVHRTPESELWLAFISDAEDHAVGLMEQRPTSEAA
jgi:predicted enzyme related to lactoylglutathione lyase